MAEVMAETNVTENQEVKETETTVETEVQDTGLDAATEQEKSIEDKLAEIMAENAKLKRKSDKDSSDAAYWKKQAMASKTESEQKAIEKAEEDAKLRNRLAELERESAINKFEKNFVALGYSEDMAKQAAEAQFDGDNDTLFQLQRKFLAEKEKSIKAQLMKTMPSPSIGNDDSISVTKEQFDAMGYKERVELLNNHPKVYEQLTKK